MQEGRYALACPKLEESLRLEGGLGTEFNLADCNEKLGKTASAWAGFTSVADAARTQNQAQREKVARDRAKALEPRVPMVTIDVAQPAPQGLELKRDGLVIGNGASTAPTPIDPGPHRLTASAPGRQSAEITFSAIEGKKFRVVVPPLAPPAQASVVPPAIVPAPIVPPPQAASSAAPPASMINTYFPDPVVERGRGQRIAGWVVGAVGLAGLGVAAGFGIDSIQKAERSKRFCDGNLCDDQGVALRERAIKSGDVATVATVAGATAVLGGLVLILTAPRASSPSASSREAAASIRAVPHVATNGGGLTIQGLLP
jgi:hypothetical protein